VSSEALDVRNRIVGRAKEGLLENATVLVSVLGAVMAFVAALLAMAAYTTSLNTRQNIMADMTALKNELRLTDVYLQEVHVLVESEGLELPPLPERD